MKFKYKKILLSMPVATMGAGLLATVLTSCSKMNIDDEKKVTLNDEGKLSEKIGNYEGYTFKDAVKMALTRSSSWATFKQALADEIVFKWYTDRMYQNDTKGTGKNKTFKSNYDQWNYQINKDYDSLVQSQKTKYGNNYKFYLQNEYLSQFGGTEASYKHAKLVEKVKTEFVSNVFKFNYFAFNNEGQEGTIHEQYPQILTKNASTTISREELNNPANWSKLGFFAATNPTYTYKSWPKTLDEAKNTDFLEFLSKNPDGDYATIQNYVFNRFFNTEKPFYSSASLFKYSKPKEIDGNDKLSAIYDASKTEVKLPDDPSEAFPFFGGMKITDASKGTRMFMEWYNALDAGKFATEYDSRTKASNGTVTIPNTGNDKYSEDSQTLLLCSGAQMIGGSESLYIPYSSVASQMYGQMMLDTPIANPYMNKSSQAYLASTVPGTIFAAIENTPAIFKNFFFTPEQYNIFSNTTTYAGNKLNSALYLPAIYDEGIVSGTGEENSPYEYHCPLFKNVKSYNYLYGNTEAIAGKIKVTNPLTGTDVWFTTNSGVIFVTNTMYIDELKPTNTTKTINGQPWALQLNTSGMHAQTIDGYDFVQNYSTYGSTATNKVEALKQVFKYRLMQQRTEQIKVISGDLLGSSGKLKTYFSNNFANIILEMATNEDAKYNIFKDINKMFEDKKDDDFFFVKVCTAENFDKAGVTAFIDATTNYDNKKKIVDSIDAANKGMYEYKSKIVQNSKSTSSMKTIYTNGLTSPLPYAYKLEANVTGHNYYTVNYIEYLQLKDDGTIVLDTQPTKASLAADAAGIQTAAAALFTQVDAATVNDSKNPFAPQIKSAKDVMSNRFWYKSAIVDKVMYAFDGTKDGVASAIKFDTYQAYADEMLKKAKESGTEDVVLKDWDAKIANPSFVKAITSTFKKSKVLTGNITYADLDSTKSADYTKYFTNINSWYANNFDSEIKIAGVNGQKTAEIALAKRLFESTLIYLSANNFENLYKNLNSKIGENEVGFVGYLDKLNPLAQGTSLDYKKGVANATEAVARYGWNPDVDNIYDQDGYLGNASSVTHSEAKGASSTYWNVIEKELINGTKSGLAGFTGIQTKTSNILDSASGMQDDVFNKFALSTYESVDVTTGTAYKQNDGAWFAYAGSKEVNGNPIKFDDVVYKDAEGNTYTFRYQQFEGNEADPDHTKITQQVLRLAKKIANYDSIDDLKSLAKSLADSYDGGSYFKQVGYGEVTYQDPAEMRYKMLEHLPHFTWDEATGKTGAYDTASEHGSKFENCFTRVKNVEAHTSSNLSSDKDYCFDDKKGNGYHLMFTQINKADITEKRLTPNWDGTKFTQPEGCPITPEEFLFILCTTALESSVQSLTVNTAIRTILKDDKLKVYDANLYNAFDSAWIKDWVKKPIGK